MSKARNTNRFREAGKSFDFRYPPRGPSTPRTTPITDEQAEQILRSYVESIGTNPTWPDLDMYIRTRKAYRSRRRARRAVNLWAARTLCIGEERIARQIRKELAHGLAFGARHGMNADKFKVAK